MIYQDQIEERLDGKVEYPDLTKALVGVVSRFGQEDILCYDYDKVIQVLMEDQGMTYDEALEWYGNNTIGSWVGETTPCFLERIEQ